MARTDDSVVALKQRQREAWAAGDWPAMSLLIDEVGHVCVDRADLGSGMEVLDVGTGAGNAAIPAAERGAIVTGLDLTPELFRTARRRATERGVEVEWVEGDAEELPFADASFDRVLSTFGVIFAPRHQLAAGELARVCRPGGRIVMCNWTPDGMVGETFTLMSEYLPDPPAWSAPPGLWGDSEYVRGLFATRGTVPAIETRVVRMPFDPDGYVDFYAEHFGPAVKARELLEPLGEWRELRDEWTALAASFYRGGRIEHEYVVVTVAR